MQNYFKRDTYLERLANCLERDSRTESAIAKEVGVSRSSLCKYKKGSTNPDPETLVNLAQAFNVSVDYLLGLTDEKSTDMEIKAITDAIGVLGEGQATLKAICKDKSLPDSSDLEDIKNEFTPFFFERFTGENVINYILSDEEAIREIAQYAKTYMMLYVISRGLSELPDNSEYKVVSNGRARELQKRNAYNFYMVNYCFERLLEGAAKRMLDDIGLATEEGAKKAGVWPLAVRLGEPEDSLFEEFNEEGDIYG